MYVCKGKWSRCDVKAKIGSWTTRTHKKEGDPLRPVSLVSTLSPPPLSLSLSETDWSCEWTTLRKDGWLAFSGSEERVVRRGNTLLLKVRTNAASSPNEWPVASFFGFRTPAPYFWVPFLPPSKIEVAPFRAKNSQIYDLQTKSEWVSEWVHFSFTLRKLRASPPTLSM
jgi:hypothetical protein